LIKEMEEVFEERKDHIPIFRSDGVCLYNPHQWLSNEQRSCGPHVAETDSEKSIYQDNGSK
jgi:hypothetical protein